VAATFSQTAAGEFVATYSTTLLSFARPGNNLQKHPDFLGSAQKYPHKKIIDRSNIDSLVLSPSCFHSRPTDLLVKSEEKWLACLFNSAAPAFVWPSPDLLPAPRGGLSSARVPSAAQTAAFPPRRTPCHLNPQPVSFLAALALPGLSPRPSASASLSVRKICPAYFFDRNRTSKKTPAAPKASPLCCG